MQYNKKWMNSWLGRVGRGSLLKHKQLVIISVYCQFGIVIKMTQILKDKL